MFDDHFDVFLADTEESKQIHYKIRFQVYCEEMGYENLEDFPMEQEFDEYDQVSAHFIVRHKETGDWVGAMRLVSNDDGLPMEQVCLLHEDVDNPQVRQSVELSRLCVIKKMRKALTQENPRHFSSTKNDYATHRMCTKDYRKANQSIIWGLLNAASEYCVHNNKLSWYFLTSDALKKVLSKRGFKMRMIGDPCDHRGKRYPFKKDAYDAYHNESWRKHFTNGNAFVRFSEHLSYKPLHH